MRQFILTHKEESPDFPLLNSERHEDFTVLSEVNAKVVGFKESGDGHIRDSKLLKTKVVPGINNFLYGEIPAWKYIYSVLEPNEWACLSHYRRKAMYPIQGVLSTSRTLWLGPSVLDHTARCHTPTMCMLLQKYLPPQYFNHLRGQMFIPYNIFCADKKTIGDWINFQEFYIRKMMADVGPDIIEFLKRDPYALKPVQGKDNRMQYQSRFWAFMSERLSTVFWIEKINLFSKKRTEEFMAMQGTTQEFPLWRNYEGSIVQMDIRLLEEGQKI